MREERGCVFCIYTCLGLSPATHMDVPDADWRHYFRFRRQIDQLIGNNAWGHISLWPAAATQLEAGGVSTHSPRICIYWARTPRLSLSLSRSFRLKANAHTRAQAPRKKPQYVRQINLLDRIAARCARPELSTRHIVSQRAPHSQFSGSDFVYLGWRKISFTNICIFAL